MIDRACISLNQRCSLQCKYCHFTGKSAAVQDAELEFSPAEARLVISNIAEYCHINRVSDFKLGIAGAGEPLLSYETLQAIVYEARKSKVVFRIYIITNGMNIDIDQISYLFRNRDIVALNFSLDGNEYIHNCFRKGYKQTMAAILLYESVFGEKPRINATVTRKSITNKECLVQFFIGNGFNRIDFSIVVDTNDTKLAISKEEYDDFLSYSNNMGIITRQKRDGIDHTYDCTMFGRLCGVGRTNIFISREGIYPCGRFFGLREYRLADYDAPLHEVEVSFHTLQSIQDGCCYYDSIVRREM